MSIRMCTTVIQLFNIGTSQFSFVSCNNPVLTSKNPIPIVALHKRHPNCTYEWKCLNKEVEFPSTPVIYTADPFLYKCSVYVDGDLCGSLHFDITYQPTIDGKYFII